MSYEIYRYIFIGAAILCGVMFITSIFLFILLRIPKVIGDLTGRTAKKAIENIRNQNASSGDKTHMSSVVNRERGKLTDKISQSGRLMRNHTDLIGGAMATEKIGTQHLNADETVVLDSYNETVVLFDESKNLQNEKTVFVPTNASTAFEIEYEITYIHTNEIISAEAVN